MDELLKHCLQELAFDGDFVGAGSQDHTVRFLHSPPPTFHDHLIIRVAFAARPDITSLAGCDASRLSAFVSDFYSSRSSMQQTLDDAYHGFIWSLVARHPSVRVGVLPNGQRADVYIPPQARVSKKDKGPLDEDSTIDRLKLVPDATRYTLEDLSKEYGDRLRISVDPETCFVAVTGTHAKPSKLTPMVYAALQIIARSRDAGVSVLDLGKAIGYDQKTCFYLVKQLVDLGFVVKLRRGGNSLNFCVHKYFFERSPTWKAIREEEYRAQGELAESTVEDDGVGSGVDFSQTPHFDPIDTRHLTRLDILRQRLFKLLRHSPNGIQPYKNISAKIGFIPKSRTDRRFFITRLNELIREGFIEKFLAPSLNPESTQSRQLFLRLSSATRSRPLVIDDSAEIADDDEEMIDCVATEGDRAEQSPLKSTLTLHKQISHLVEESWTTGTTLNNLSDRLGSFDKKTLDLLVTRMERKPPPHLADLTVYPISEFFGRERRHRFFTLNAYYELAKQENLKTPKGAYSVEDIAQAGDFASERQSHFYTDSDDLQEFYKKWRGVRIQRLKAFTEEPHRDYPSKSISMHVPLNFGTLRSSSKKWTNPILPDGTRKRGRPPKNLNGSTQPSTKRMKKAISKEAFMKQAGWGTEGASIIDVPTVAEPTETSKRQREELEGEAAQLDPPNGNEADLVVPKRKRGRPPKKRGHPLKKRRVDDLSVLPAGSTSLTEKGVPSGTEIERLQITYSASNLGADVPISIRSERSRNELGDTNRVPLPLDASGDSAMTCMRSRLVTSPRLLEEPVHAPAQDELTDTSVTPSHQHSLFPPSSNSQTLFGGSMDTSKSKAGEASNDAAEAIEFLAAPVVVSFTARSSAREGEVVETHQNLRNKTINGTVTHNDQQEEVGTTDGMHVHSTRLVLDAGDQQLADVPPAATIRVNGHSSRGKLQKRENLSSLRRENEIIHLIESAGGVLNISTPDFHAAFTRLVQATAKAGEAASSSVGATPDRRTLNYALDKLKATGRIKVMTTNSPSMAGLHRNVRVAYLPTIPEERVRSWLEIQSFSEAISPRCERVSEGVQVTQTEPTVAADLAKQWLHAKDAHEARQERWHRNSIRAGQLLAQSEDVVREALLMERQTLSQLYGYVPEKIIRARRLHLYMIELFEHGVESEFISDSRNRVVNWAFFENDLSLATHCACFTASHFIPDIKQYLESDERRKTPVKSIPDYWKHVLQIGKSRTRDRIFDLLGYLHSLRLVFPLMRIGQDEQEGSSEDVRFKAMPSDWTSQVPLIRPDFWQFCATAPVHTFALRHDPAPFWKTLPIASRDEAEQYWAELKRLSLDKSRATEVQRQLLEPGATCEPYDGELRVATALRRSTSWRSGYILSWYQTQYLEQFIDRNNGRTPLQDGDLEEVQLRKLSDTIHAPLDIVKEFYASRREAVLTEFDKKHRRQAQEILKKREIGAKILLAKSSLEAVKNREAAWDAMLRKVHPGLVRGVAEARLRKLRKSFVQGNVIQDNLRWEKQIMDAIKAAEKMRSNRRLFPNASQTWRVAAQKSPEAAISQPPCAYGQGMSVDTLVRMQKNLSADGDGREGDDVPRDKAKKKARGPHKDGVRRQRFQWNPDYDELVRDAYAIVRARCRAHYRTEWGALEQIFPSLPTSSIRARLSALKEQPGASAYLQRLENCWYELWLKKRGTPELLDPNPRSPTDFDLKVHLEYFRRHVDKNTLRVGVSTSENKGYTSLPSDLDAFVSAWCLEERKSPHTGWEFLINYSIAEESRERLFLDTAFILENEGPDDEHQSDALLFAEATLKMVNGTPDECYDADGAAALLHGIGEEIVVAARDSLHSRNVLATRVRDSSGAVSGRRDKISELNQNALGGPLSKELFVDASQLGDSYTLAKDEWREWPLTSTDGDTAALLQRISGHQVKFQVSTAHAQACRAGIDGNSRKVGDDDIELGLQIRLTEPVIPEFQLPSAWEDDRNLMEPENATAHGLSATGDKTCCGVCSSGVIDCLKCIEETRRQINEWPEDERTLANIIISLADEKGKDGISIDELTSGANLPESGYLLHRLHTCRVPVLYFAGYNSSLIVSAKYAGAWVLTLPGETVPVSKIFPRRWLDIIGARLTLVWEAGLRAVVGLIHLKPGTSQAELRWRLKAVYDRQEVLDLLSHLMSHGALKIFWRGEWRYSEATICIHALSKEEERNVFWAIREDKRWYRISR